MTSTLTATSANISAANSFSSAGNVSSTILSLAIDSDSNLVTPELIGGAIGGALGGVLLIAVVIVVCCVAMRKRNRKPVDAPPAAAAVAANSTLFGAGAPAANNAQTHYVAFDDPNSHYEESNIQQF